jgi:hypothetical protein
MVLSSQKSETITFSTIENGCGIGKISGKIEAVVTENSLVFLLLIIVFSAKEQICNCLLTKLVTEMPTQ